MIVKLLRILCFSFLLLSYYFLETLLYVLDLFLLINSILFILNILFSLDASFVFFVTFQELLCARSLQFVLQLLLWSISQVQRRNLGQDVWRQRQTLPRMSFLVHQDNAPSMLLLYSHRNTIVVKYMPVF
jgi:hypothetical protein